MSIEDIFSRWVSEWWDYVLNLTPFASNLSYIYLTRLDPYSDYGSGSTKVLITSPIWIRIHNTLVVGIFFMLTWFKVAPWPRQSLWCWCRILRVRRIAACRLAWPAELRRSPGGTCGERSCWLKAAAYSSPHYNPTKTSRQVFNFIYNMSRLFYIDF